MARRNLLEGLASLPETVGPTTAYPMRGAGKSLVRSLDELARQADKFLEGEAVVELDPEQIEASFVKDRLSQDDAAFEDLKEAIRERGQDSPVLVRPLTTASDRYQLVFGHRRVRAARELGRTVRAVVKTLDDRAHVIAQGQENSARANLSFIERALFARRLDGLGYERAVITAALAANAAAVSKMLSVTERLAGDLIEAIGPAPGIGRERWVEMSLLAGRGSSRETALRIAGAPSFAAMASDARFEHLYKALNQAERPVRKSQPVQSKTKWQPADKAVKADIIAGGKTFSISLKARNAQTFGAFLSQNLDGLYERFLAENGNEGD